MKNLVKELYQILESVHICLVPFMKWVQYSFNNTINVFHRINVLVCKSKSNNEINLTDSIYY